MSHVATIELEIKDLDSLAKAAKDLGLEFVEGQTTYKWFGRSVGYYPLPAGFTGQDLGQCSHALRIPGNSQAYEIGVVKRRDGKPGYTLMWDFWHGGFGLEKQVGKNADRLKQAYAVQLSGKVMRKQGYLVSSKVSQDGRVILTARK